MDHETATTTWLDLERLRFGDIRSDLGAFAAAEMLRAPGTAAAAVAAFCT